MVVKIYTVSSHVQTSSTSSICREMHVNSDTVKVSTVESLLLMSRSINKRESKMTKT